jgi:hypothetical protein
MRIGPAVAAIVVALSLSACVRQNDAPEAEGGWVGTITTDGNVTTVVNESGSVWGGAARLVEEASIGVETGADEYMFGFINSMYANDDRIVVLDEHTNIVRMYDHEGRFLFNVGGEGQGPGEYTDAIIVTMTPEGRTYVFDVGNRRLTEYTRDGDYSNSWPFPDFGCCAWGMHWQPQGLLSMPVQELDRETRERRYGIQLFSPEADDVVSDPRWVPDFEFEETTYNADGDRFPTPFSPRVVWQPTPAGGIVAGATDRYSFEVLGPADGRTVIERVVEPVPIDPAEREWQRRLTVVMWRRSLESFNWDGAEMPPHRPAFSWFAPAVSGEIWVSREVGSERVADCLQDPLEDYAGETSIRQCYRRVLTFDVFGKDGRYLGEVDLPEPRPSLMYVNGRTVLGYVEDEAGTIIVKRYRLALPGEQ